MINKICLHLYILWSFNFTPYLESNKKEYHIVQQKTPIII